LSLLPLPPPSSPQQLWLPLLSGLVIRLRTRSCLWLRSQLLLLLVLLVLLLLLSLMLVLLLLLSLVLLMLLVLHLPWIHWHPGVSLALLGSPSPCFPSCCCCQQLALLGLRGFHPRRLFWP
jgi:hypothetical protein